jgi:AraC-like DNA-binding protein
MHALVGQAWSVASLASRVGLSRAGFAARFTELVGEPPLEYLARWRVTCAAELLRDKGEVVSTIAARVGYDSTHRSTRPSGGGRARAQAPIAVRPPLSFRRLRRRGGTPRPSATLNAGRQDDVLDVLARRCRVASEARGDLRRSYAFPQAPMAVTMGPRLAPSWVNVYSTRGGTSA